MAVQQPSRPLKLPLPHQRSHRKRRNWPQRREFKLNDDSWCMSVGVYTHRNFTSSLHHTYSPTLMKDNVRVPALGLQWYIDYLSWIPIAMRLRPCWSSSYTDPIAVSDVDLRQHSSKDPESFPTLFRNRILQRLCISLLLAPRSRCVLYIH